MNKSSDKIVEPGGVGEYIARCPEDVQHKLEEIRTAIRSVAPESIETVSYFQIPGYSYEGYDYNGMFVWFSFKAPYVRLHVRPSVIQDHKSELEAYRKTASIVSFPVDDVIPISLVKKLVLASLNVMKNKSKEDV
jgi:uncharacterized protein YdhG (YjbR/CyaY superfamily)